MSKIVLIFLFVGISFQWVGLNATNPLDVRYFDETSDTTAINALLSKARTTLHPKSTPSESMTFFAKEFLGTPYVPHTLESPEGEPEALTVNLSQLDCTTLVETVTALAMSFQEGRYSWHDYIYNLRRLRYRGGETNGYASRLHYIADWAVDNIHKGIIADATVLMPRYSKTERTLDYMTSNRDSYPALKSDSLEYERMKRIEYGYLNHRFNYLRTGDLNDRKLLGEMREGDILAFVSNLKNLDVTHMGILVSENGQWHVLHASQTEGEVVISKQKLVDFVKRNPKWIGLRIFRLK